MVICSSLDKPLHFNGILIEDECPPILIKCGLGLEWDGVTVVLSIPSARSTHWLRATKSQWLCTVVFFCLYFLLLFVVGPLMLPRLKFPLTLSQQPLTSLQGSSVQHCKLHWLHAHCCLGVMYTCLYEERNVFQTFNITCNKN